MSVAHSEPVTDVRIHAVYYPPAPPRPRHPCEEGLHRWAWLTNGRQACGYCGKPR